MAYFDVYYPVAIAAAQRYGVDPAVFARQIEVESGWNPNAFSPAGACGIAQIVPQYHPGVDCWDPEASLDYAARLMRSYLDRYGGDYARALACYNCGCGCVDRAVASCGDQWVNCLPDETRRYLALILGEIGTAPAPGPSTPAVEGGLSPLVPVIAVLLVIYLLA